jgi:hypothetical protein
MNQRITMLKILKSKHWSSTGQFLSYFYKAYISPIFEYANFALLSANGATLNKIQKVQNKALRICQSKTIYDRVDTMHVESNMLNVKDRLNNLSNNYVSKIQK